MIVINKYGSLLRNKRVELQMTQEAVSIKVGISRSYYSDIENGKAFPSGKTLLKLNDVLPIFLNINDANRDFKEV